MKDSLNVNDWILNLFNEHVETCELLDAVPYFEYLEEGTYVFVIDKDCVISTKDVSLDCCAPWSGAKDDGTRVTTKTLSIPISLSEDSKYEFDSSSRDFILKLRKNVHAKEQHLKRTIAFILDSNENVVSHYLYVYDVLVSMIPPLNNDNKVLPSCNDVVKKALHNRTTKEAKKYLASQGIVVSSQKLSSLSRSVPSHVKSNQGRKVPSNFFEVMNRYALKENDDETLLEPKIFVNEDGSVDSLIIIGYPRAFRCFGKWLPDREDLNDHRKAVMPITNMSPQDASNYFASFLNENDSCAIPTIGSTIMLDTTFSLASQEYTTVVLGIGDSFKTKKSRKNAAILIAIMIHSRKIMEHHEMFSKFLNEMLLKYCEGKYVGCICHDGEASFQVYNTGPILKDAILLRCDVHRLNNIKEICSKDKDSDQFNDIKLALFGRKEQTSCGNIIRKGLLNIFNKDEYNMRMKELAAKSEENIRKWLLDNLENLYTCNSMFSKLLAGWPAHYLTTNIIEARNSHIKLIVTRKLPAQKLLDEFLLMHREEMKELRFSVINRSEKYSTFFAISEQEYMRKSFFEKKHFLDSFGLILEGLETLSNYPDWLYQDKKIPKPIFLERLNQLLVHNSQQNNNYFFVLNTKDSFDSGYIVRDTHTLECFHVMCKKKKYNYKLCVHEMAVLMSLADEEKDEIIKKLTEIKNNTSLFNIMQSQIHPSHGTKFPKRKFTSRSQTNESRKFINLMNTTSSSCDLDAQ